MASIAKAAKLNHIEANQFLLEYYYRAEQWDKALVIMKKLGEELGDTDSQVSLAEMYEEGDVFQKDLEKAKSLYTKAAEKGNEDAIKALKRFE